MTKKVLLNHTKFYLKSVLCLLLIFIFSGCQLFIGDRNLEIKKKVVSQAFEDNKDLMREYLITERDTYTSKGESAGLTEEEINYYLNNPDIVVEELLEEEQGEEYLDYIYTTLTTTDNKIILEKARPLITEDQYSEIKAQIDSIDDVTYNNEQFISKSDANGPDKYLHLMAGAAVAAITACSVYLLAKWNPWVKVGAILGLGVACALLAGAAKELYDLTDDSCDPNFDDLIVTTLGGFLASSLCTILGSLSIIISEKLIFAAIFYAAIAVYTFNESDFIPWVNKYILKKD